MTTANASYNATYSVSDNKLQSLTAVILETYLEEGPGADGTAQMFEHQKEAGRIMVDGYGNVSTSSMKYSEKLPLYMTDFVKLIRTVSGEEKEEEKVV